MGVRRGASLWALLWTLAALSLPRLHAAGVVYSSKAQNVTRAPSTASKRVAGYQAHAEKYERAKMAERMRKRLRTNELRGVQKRTPVNTTHVTMFLHLSKSGGSSMCTLAKKQPTVHMSSFQQRHGCNAPHEGHEQGPGESWWRKPQLTSCAKVFEFNRHGSDYIHLESLFHPGLRACTNVTYFTILRDPLLRILSHQAHWNISLQHVSDVLTGKLQLPQTAAYTQQVGVFDNYYTRYLLGEEVFWGPPGSITERHLEEAIGVLDSFALVIPLPKFKLSLLPVLRTVLGWKLETELFRNSNDSRLFMVNRHGDHGEADLAELREQHPTEWAILRKHNAIDLRLYQHVLDRWEERWGTRARWRTGERHGAERGQRGRGGGVS